MIERILRPLAFVIVLGTSTMFAQPDFLLGIGADVMVPVGPFKQNYLTGFGGTVRLQFNISRHIGFTASAGFLTWNEKGSSSMELKGAPVRVGIKVSPFPAKNNTYLLTECGPFFGIIGETSIARFSAAAVLGFEHQLESSISIDLSARYDYIATQGRPSANIGGRIGVSFGV